MHPSPGSLAGNPTHSPRFTHGIHSPQFRRLMKANESVMAETVLPFPGVVTVDAGSLRARRSRWSELARRVRAALLRVFRCCRCCRCCHCCRCCRCCVCGGPVTPSIDHRCASNVRRLRIAAALTLSPCFMPESDTVTRGGWTCEAALPVEAPRLPLMPRLALADELAALVAQRSRSDGRA